MSATRSIIRPPLPTLDAGAAFGQPSSMVVRGGPFLFVAGLTAIDPASGRRERGTAASETARILANLKIMLEEAGSSLDSVVKVTVLLSSMLEAPNVNEIFARTFPTHPPARTTCGVTLPDGVRVMIECTALA